MYYQLDDKAILRDERVYLDSGLSTLYLAKNDEILFLDEKGCEIAIYLLEPRTYNDISTKYFSLKLAKDKKELDEFLFELKTKGFINIFDGWRYGSIKIVVSFAINYPSVHCYFTCCHLFIIFLPYF